MGTHPIFESDFDCLTDCYLGRKCNVLKNSNHGEALESDR